MRIRSSAARQPRHSRHGSHAPSLLTRRWASRPAVAAVLSLALFVGLLAAPAGVPVPLLPQIPAAGAAAPPGALFFEDFENLDAWDMPSWPEVGHYSASTSSPQGKVDYSQAPNGSGDNLSMGTLTLGLTNPGLGTPDRRYYTSEDGSVPAASPALGEANYCNDLVLSFNNGVNTGIGENLAPGGNAGTAEQDGNGVPEYGWQNWTQQMFSPSDNQNRCNPDVAIQSYNQLRTMARAMTSFQKGWTQQDALNAFNSQAAVPGPVDGTTIPDGPDRNDVPGLDENHVLASFTECSLPAQLVNAGGAGANCPTFMTQAGDLASAGNALPGGLPASTVYRETSPGKYIGTMPTGRGSADSSVTFSKADYWSVYEYPGTHGQTLPLKPEQGVSYSIDFDVVSPSCGFTQGGTRQAAADPPEFHFQIFNSKDTWDVVAPADANVAGTSLSMLTGYPGGPIGPSSANKSLAIDPCGATPSPYVTNVQHLGADTGLDPRNLRPCTLTANGCFLMTTALNANAVPSLQPAWMSAMPITYAHVSIPVGDLINLTTDPNGVASGGGGDAFGFRMFNSTITSGVSAGYNSSTDYIAGNAWAIDRLGLVPPDVPTQPDEPQLSVVKNLPNGRAAAADQFTLAVEQGGAAVGAATTTGSSSGEQAQKVGPLPATPGAAYRITEQPADPATDLAAYATSYACRDTTGAIPDAQLPSGTGTEFTLDYPVPPPGRVPSIVCTVTNTPPDAPALVCTDLYLISGDAANPIVGSVPLGGIGSGAASVTRAFGLPAGITSPDGLALDATGDHAYFLGTVQNAAGTNERRLYTYTAATQQIASARVDIGGSSPTGASRTVAGAVNPTNGWYYFGAATSNSLENLYRYNPADGTFAQVAPIPAAATTPNAVNGDIAFDADGNMYLAGPGAIIKIAAANVLNGTLASGATISSTPDAARAGLAFDASGKLYLQSSAFSGSTPTSSGIVQINPANGAVIGASSPIDLAASDMAGCAPAPSLTLRKDVADRVNPGDQFALTIAAGAATLGTATTAGTATGIQAQQAGPIAPAGGTQYTLSESAAGTADLTQYVITWACVDVSTNGPVTGTANGASFALTFPAGAAQVVCTITNAPALPQLDVIKTGASISLDPATGEGSARYDVEVSNRDGQGATTYGPLVDTPAFSPGLVVVGIRWTVTGDPAGGVVPPAGGGPLAAGATSIELAPAGTPIAAGQRHLFVVIVTFSYTGDPVTAPTCDPSVGAGHGAFNSVALPAGQENADNGSNTACLSLTQFQLLKLDSGGQPVDGSTWSVSTDDGGPGTALALPVVPVVLAGGSTPETGLFAVAGLPAGTYWLTEVQAPAGHELLAQPIRLAVAADGAVTIDPAVAGVSVAQSNGVYRISVADSARFVLPFAGGSGDRWIVLIGFALLAAAAAAGALTRRLRRGAPSTQ